jgi:hypothetical protein
MARILIVDDEEALRAPIMLIYHAGLATEWPISWQVTH